MVGVNLASDAGILGVWSFLGRFGVVLSESGNLNSRTCPSMPANLSKRLAFAPRTAGSAAD
eukprot:4260423-Amphidinium_carterae.1